MFKYFKNFAFVVDFYIIKMYFIYAFVGDASPKQKA
jgi:hypothetical protein